MNIMIVDDEQDVKILFQQKFRREIRSGQLVLHFAFSAQSALAHLEHPGSRFALVLSDINMPGMSGLELLRRIKVKFESLQVWMITAYSDDHNYRQAQEYGCGDYMTKPLDFDSLKEKILSAMRTQ
jgi:DNA-binding NtrC family response regulator